MNLKSIFKFGYDAIASTPKRKGIQVSYRTEDQELRSRQRAAMSSNVRDIQRNFCVGAWAIRKHLDYVSTFTFQSRTGDKQLDKDIEAFLADWGKPENCDAAGRHSLPRLVRLAEERRTIDGDVLCNFLPDGRLQFIEGDRVASESVSVPPDTFTVPLDQIVNGVIVDRNGKSLGYVVAKRMQGASLQYDVILSAAYAYLHGYYTRFDQVRGVSPLAPAINTLRDLYEGLDYALAKAKVSQLFALAFYRESSDQMGALSEVAADTEGADPKYQIDFGKGPVQLDLDPGDRAEFLESKTPSDQFQAFTQVMTGIALKALDIPYSFYDEAHTNYSGARQALLQYEQSAEIKRNDNRLMLDWITRLRLRKAVADGDLQLPRGSKAADLRWEWVGDGPPWIDPLKEVNANIAAIGAGLTSPQRVCKAQSGDYEDIIDEIASAQDYAKGKGVALSFNPQLTAQDANNDRNQNAPA
jgi:lambda family phage portal protein